MMKRRTCTEIRRNYIVSKAAPRQIGVDQPYRSTLSKRETFSILATHCHLQADILLRIDFAAGTVFSASNAPMRGIRNRVRRLATLRVQSPALDAARTRRRSSQTAF